jgi:hypothetical protein
MNFDIKEEYKKQNEMIYSKTKLENKEKVKEIIDKWDWNNPYRKVILASFNENCMTDILKRFLKRRGDYLSCATILL